MGTDFDAVEREVMSIRAAVLRCADVDDDDAVGELFSLVDRVLTEGCPPRTAVALLVRAFTVRASTAA